MEDWDLKGTIKDGFVVIDRLDVVSLTIRSHAIANIVNDYLRCFCLVSERVG